MISAFEHRNGYPTRMREGKCKGDDNYDDDYNSNNNCDAWHLYFRLVTGNVSNNLIFCLIPSYTRFV
jgi:hypothetical protein